MRAAETSAARIVLFTSAAGRLGMKIRGSSAFRVLALAAVLAPAAADAQRLSTACTEGLLDDPSPRAEFVLAPNSHRAILLELRDEVRAAAAAAGIAEARGYLVVQHRRGSRRATHRVVRGNVPSSLVAEVHRRMAARLDEAPGDEPVVLFATRLDPTPDLSGIDTTASTVVECRPELLNASDLSGRLMSLLERTAPNGNPPMSLGLVMLVTRDGEVAHAELRRSSSIPQLDRAIVRDVPRTLRFAPGSVAGIPMDMWVEQPLGIPYRMPPPRRTPVPNRRP